VARLPNPGSDDGTWGDILNDFLSAQHNADGTHNLVLDDLSNIDTTGAANGQVLKFNGTTWVADTDLSGGGDPAMGGDLSGTASNAQIVAGAVADTEVAAGANIAQSKVANLTSDLASKADETVTITGATSLTGGGDLTANRTLTLLNDAATPGNSRYYGTDGAGAKGFHTIPTQDPAMGGDLSGTASSAQIVAGAIVDADVNASAAIAQSKIANLTADLAAKVDDSEKGAANGVATLDGSGKLPPGQLAVANITKVLPYSYLGNLVVGAGTFRLYNDMGATWTISGVRASVGAAPAGASIIVDVHKNGTTIFTTQANRPTIAIAGNTSGNVTNFDITTVAAGEYLTVDIDQIGSTTAGADLTVQIEVV
jgi:hypothetical protein